MVIYYIPLCQCIRLKVGYLSDGLFKIQSAENYEYATTEHTKDQHEPQSSREMQESDAPSRTLLIFEVPSSLWRPSKWAYLPDELSQAPPSVRSELLTSKYFYHAGYRSELVRIGNIDLLAVSRVTSNRSMVIDRSASDDGPSHFSCERFTIEWGHLSL